jgi:MFS family permease
MLGAAHKPGAMPLRPLGLGDIYDAAFRIIRFNPKATVGSAVLVASVAMAVPVVVTLVLTATVSTALDETGNPDDQALIGFIGSFGSLGVGSLLVALGTILVTGMIAHVTAAAAIGRRLNLGEAWAATRGKRWRLVGLAFLLGLALALMIGLYVLAWVLVVLADNTGLAVAWGIVTVPAFVCLLVWFWVRVYYLPVPALMLEPVGVFGAVRRGFGLTRRQFWRTLGIALLTVLIVAFAGQVLTFPIGLVGNVISLTVPPQYAILALVVTQAVAQVISAAFVTPFSAAVTSLQYLDQRMRKEAYDVELMQQAGITAS